MKQIILIVVVAVACGAVGYELGRQSTADAWQKERKKMFEQRRGLASKIRSYREIIRYTNPLLTQEAGKKASSKPATTAKAATRPTAKR